MRGHEKREILFIQGMYKTSHTFSNRTELFHLYIWGCILLRLNRLENPPLKDEST